MHRDPRARSISWRATTNIFRPRTAATQWRSGGSARLIPVPVPLLRALRASWAANRNRHRLCDNLQVDTPDAQLRGWYPRFVNEGCADAAASFLEFEQTREKEPRLACSPFARSVALTGLIRRNAIERGSLTSQSRSCIFCATPAAAGLAFVITTMSPPLHATSEPVSWPRTGLVRAPSLVALIVCG